MSEPRIHPLALTAIDKLQRGRINRREFLRYTTLLGVSVGTAYALAGCAPAAAPTSAGAPAAAGGITRGGTLRKGMLIQQIDHFFSHYKDLEPGKWMKLQGWRDAATAKKEILTSVERYQSCEPKPNF